MDLRSFGNGERFTFERGKQQTRPDKVWTKLTPNLDFTVSHLAFEKVKHCDDIVTRVSDHRPLLLSMQVVKKSRWKFPEWILRTKAGCTKMIEKLKNSRSIGEVWPKLRSAVEDVTQELTIQDKYSNEVMDAKFFIEPDLFNPSTATTRRIKKSNNKKVSQNLSQKAAVTFFKELYHGKKTKNILSTLNKTVSEKDVEQAIESSPKNKSPGLDGIPYELFKSCSEFFIPLLTKDFNFLLKGNVTDKWKKGITSLLP